ncbi:hypothetical protein SBADM41S_09961 [Streptomyces badius]
MLNSVRPCGCRGPAGASSWRSGRSPAATAPPPERPCSSVRGNGVSAGDTYTGSKNHRRRSVRGAGTDGRRLDRAGHTGRRRAGAGLGVLVGHREPPGHGAAHHHLHQPRPAAGLCRRRCGGTPLGLRRLGPDRHRRRDLRPAAARRLDRRRRPGAGRAPRPGAAHHVRRAGGRARPDRCGGGGPPPRAAGRGAPGGSGAGSGGGRLPAPGSSGGDLHRLGDPAAVRLPVRALPRVVHRRGAPEHPAHRGAARLGHRGDHPDVPGGGPRRGRRGGSRTTARPDRGRVHSRLRCAGPGARHPLRAVRTVHRPRHRGAAHPGEPDLLAPHRARRDRPARAQGRRTDSRRRPWGGPNSWGGGWGAPPPGQPGPQGYQPPQAPGFGPPPSSPPPRW